MPASSAHFRAPRALLTAFIVALAAALPALPAASADEKPRTLSLAGLGTAKAAPDRAHITTGVVSEGKTARAALDENTAAMTRVVAALKAQGLEAKDIQTTSFAVRPKYERPREGAAPRIVGYRVVNTVALTVRALPRLGAILDTVVSLGSNEIGGISFSVSDADKRLDAARERAMADAIRKAKLYATAAGAKLGKVRRIEERTHVPEPRPVFARAAAAREAAPVPIEPGEQTLTARVTVTWELE